MYEQKEANLEMPLTPKSTVIVYVAQMSSNIKIVNVVLVGMFKIEASAEDNNGVAKENVVAVAHTMAKMAIISMIFPIDPSTLFPNSGLTASENR